MKRFTRVGLFGLLLAGCTAEEGTTLEIIGVAGPEDDCKYTTDPTVYLGSGLYDPWGIGYGDSNGFTMAVVVNNNLAPTENSPVDSFEVNVRPSANSVLLSGFDVCFVHVDEPVETSTYSAGCEGVGEDLSAFIPATVTIDPAGFSLGFVSALTPDHLKQIFGERFSPGDIAQRGVVNESVLGEDYNNNGTLTDNLFFLGPEPPDETNRNEAWGTYPTRPDTLVLVKMRAVGKTQSGSNVESNWMSFGVNICLGCFTDQCGALEAVDCGGSSGYSGYFPDWSNFDGCVPYQQAPACVLGNTCI